MLDRTEMVYMCVCGMLQVILSEVQCFCRVTVYTTLICMTEYEASKSTVDEYHAILIHTQNGHFPRLSKVSKESMKIAKAVLYCKPFIFAI